MRVGLGGDMVVLLGKTSFFFFLIGIIPGDLRISIRLRGAELRLSSRARRFVRAVVNQRD